MGDATPSMLAAAVAILAVVASLPLPVLFRFRRLSPSAGSKNTKTPLPTEPNTADDWLRRCVAAHGPVSRPSLFSCPTAGLPRRRLRQQVHLLQRRLLVRERGRMAMAVESGRERGEGRDA
ncbi:unnamed protein product [Urochloa humidicola]